MHSQFTCLNASNLQWKVDILKYKVFDTNVYMRLCVENSAQIMFYQFMTHLRLIIKQVSFFSTNILNVNTNYNSCRATFVTWFLFYNFKRLRKNFAICFDHCPMYRKFMCFKLLFSVLFRHYKTVANLLDTENHKTQIRPQVVNSWSWKNISKMWNGIGGQYYLVIQYDDYMLPSF